MSAKSNDHAKSKKIDQALKQINKTIFESRAPMAESIDRLKSIAKEFEVSSKNIATNIDNEKLIKVFPKVKIISNGPRTGDTHVVLSPKTELGSVQKIKWEHEVGQLPKAEIFTIVTPVELEFLQANTNLTFVFGRDYFWANFRHLFLVWWYNLTKGLRKTA